MITPLKGAQSAERLLSRPDFCLLLGCRAPSPFSSGASVFIWAVCVPVGPSVAVLSVYSRVWASPHPRFLWVLLEADVPRTSGPGCPAPSGGASHGRQGPHSVHSSSSVVWGTWSRAGLPDASPLPAQPCSGPISQPGSTDDGPHLCLPHLILGHQVASWPGTSLLCSLSLSPLVYKVGTWPCLLRPLPARQTL